jgi:Cytochrome c554 and c-prime
MSARKHGGIASSLRKSPELALAIVLAGSTCLAAMLQTAGLPSVSLATETRVQDPGWWPTKGQPAREEYVGNEACTKCHAGKASTYETAAMAHAAAPAAASEGLRQYGRLSLQVGPFNYRILTKGETSILSVAEANSSLSRRLTWAFGEAHMGQTYVYEENGSLYEGHLSFFTSLPGLDVTPGQTRSESLDLEEAAGRRMDLREAQRCFGCHTTASTAGKKFDPDNSVPGVRCEACHGPGVQHVIAMGLGTGEGPSGIFNPGRLSPVDSVDFCGACHRTWQDVVEERLVALGVFNVRFAPYRLENSRCWGNGDARITCTACHDPHKRLVTDAGSYDPVCLRCHVTRGVRRSVKQPGAPCPAAAANCVTCHMPKYEPPGLHAKFTDHWIRVVHSGKPYPS